MAFIYKITNQLNGKLYIGKTSLPSVEERFKEHIRASKQERNEKRPLYDAMNKYGIENFFIEQLEEVENDKQASEREIYWINKLNTYIGFSNCNGYNATLGGDSRRLYNYQKIAHKYLELQNEQAVANFFNCDRTVVKHACQENNIEILSTAEVSKKQFSKKIAQVDKETGEVLNIFNSISDAFRALNKTKSGGIAKACREDKIYLGYKWKYI